MADDDTPRDDITGTAKGGSRLRLLRDVVVCQVKLGLEALLDITLIPVSLVAAGLAFYAFGRTSGHWLGGLVAGAFFIVNPVTIEAFGGEMVPQVALVLWALTAQAMGRPTLAVALAGWSCPSPEPSRPHEPERPTPVARWQERSTSLAFDGGLSLRFAVAGQYARPVLERIRDEVSSQIRSQSWSSQAGGRDTIDLEPGLQVGPRSVSVSLHGIGTASL